MSGRTVQAAPPHAPPAGNRVARLEHAVAHAAHRLPAQGPIGVFIHHNTLHSFQHMPFEEAVAAASTVFGAEPYMSETAYRDSLAKGRIHEDDVRTVVSREGNEIILPGRLDRHSLRSTLLIGGQTEFDAATIDWVLEEMRLLEPDGHKLFAACLERPECEIADATSCDALITFDDEIIHPLLIRLIAAFLDQGMAYWPMPNRESGFLHAVRLLLSQGWAIFPERLERLGDAFRSQLERDQGAEDVVITALDSLGVPEEDWEQVLTAELLALPGWAGIVHKLERQPGLAPYARVPCSLMEFLAVRLTLKRVAAADVEKRRNKAGVSARALTAQRRAEAAKLWDALRRLGLSDRDLASLKPAPVRRLIAEIQSFDQLERRRLLHLAYEFRHEQDILQPLALYRRQAPPERRERRPAADIFFCIDEREESIRRHLEEAAPEVATHSSAGFFSVAMEYTGIDDAHGAALCPVVVTPKHSVREQPLRHHTEVYNSRISRRRTWARLARQTYLNSRTLIRGWLNTAYLWPLAVFPLVMRIVSPITYGRLERAFLKSAIPNPLTELAFERSGTEPHIPSDGLLRGFTVEEMTDRVAGTLGNAGLREGFARLVVTIGHGSTSLNNPHESAHDCGACGGGRGGPNGRVFAAMANHGPVRTGLRNRGFAIPDDVWFIGGYHDTSNADITLFDLDRVPESHRAELVTLRATFDKARALDAQERARRFEAASPDGRPERSLYHVRDRADQLAEPRPEYGHCTNAVCIVGRRELTRGLFLDRRAFLVSYDAAQDPADKALAGLLGAVVPVCAGISLEYYFSFVDNERYGCGTKLPHNVTGLLGVMNGPSSDLRTGLPWQMVEIHEPVRILFVVETTPERVMKVMSANPELTEFLENRWMRLATMDPDSGEVCIYRDEGFEKLEPTMESIPCVPRSVDWFRGHIGHLPIARIAGPC